MEALKGGGLCLGTLTGVVSQERCPGERDPPSHSGGPPQGVPPVNALEQGGGICPGIEVQKVSRILSLSKKIMCLLGSTGSWLWLAGSSIFIVACGTFSFG